MMVHALERAVVAWVALSAAATALFVALAGRRVSCRARRWVGVGAVGFCCLALCVLLVWP